MAADSDFGNGGGTIDALVVGAGLSGLVVAYALRESGMRVVTTEIADRPGGVLATRERDGFRYETAANSALDDGVNFGPLLRSLGIEGERIDTAKTAAKRFVVRDARLQPLPMSPPALLTTSTFSARAKLRLLREPLVPKRATDREESVADFARRRLGDEWLDYAVDPFVSGVHAGDPEALSVQAAFPRLHALEQAHGSLLLGQLRRARARKGPTPASFSFRGGMQTLTDALAARVDVLTGTRTSISPQSDGSFDVVLTGSRATNRLRARCVVLATPADAASELVATFAPQAEHPLQAIAYAPVAIVVAAYRREDVVHPLDGFGFLVPSRERRAILGTLFSSTMFEGRAPPGHVLLTTFIGGQRNPHSAALDDDSLQATVARELRELIGAGDALWMETVRWPRAIPQYTLGHGERIAAIDRATAHLPTLFFSANWRGGVSLADCIARSHRTAASVAEALRPQAMR